MSNEDIAVDPFAPLLTYHVVRRRWRLAVTYVHEAPAFTLVIPAGFVFDLASVPRMVWWMIAPFELSIAAPLVHDFLYRYSGMLASGEVITRRVADRLFWELMVRELVPGWRRVLSYIAVRLFGWMAWGRG